MDLQQIQKMAVAAGDLMDGFLEESHENHGGCDAGSAATVAREMFYSIARRLAETEGNVDNINVSSEAA